MSTPFSSFDPQGWIVRAEVVIEEIEPPIVRMLELPAAANLAELHEVLQAAFGWTDSHLHQFHIGGLSYGAPEFGEGYDADRRTFEATGVRLWDLSFRHDGPLIVRYEYDFGDCWMHRLSMKQCPREVGVTYPRCVSGQRSGPPEDVGGSHGYADFVSAWSDPTHEQHRAMKRWVGRKFDPERFDLEATNKAIRSAMRRAKGDYIFRRTG